MKFPLLLLFATLASAQTELSGRVIDADGAPVKNARVTVLRYDFRNGRKQPVSIGRNATADARGEFQIQNIEQGRYYLRAEDPASSTRNPNALLLPSVIDRNLPTTLLTDTGSGIQIEMQRGHTYSVRGTVTPANVQAQVNVTDSTGASVDFANVNAATGAFEIEDLPPGRYTLLVRTTPGRSAGPESPARVFARADIDVTGNIDGLMLKLAPGFEVAGRITIEGSAKLPVSVILSPAEAAAAPVLGTVAADGTFRIRNLAPLKYFWSFESLDPGTYVKSISDNEVVLSSNAATLMGTTTGALVTLWPKTPAPWDPTAGIRNAEPDPQGVFRISGLAPGNYSVVAWEQSPQDLATFPEFLARITAPNISIAVRETSKLTPIVILRETLATEILRFP